MYTIQLINQYVTHFFFLYFCVCLSFYLWLSIDGWWKTKRARETGCVRNRTCIVCDNILPDNEHKLCLSLCLKNVHAIKVCGIYIYTNMIKGYIAEYVSIIVWTNHFVHNKNIYIQENMISDGDRSHLYLIRTDR
jgi:hypothetical protein